MFDLTLDNIFEKNSLGDLGDDTIESSEILQNIFNSIQTNNIVQDGLKILTARDLDLDAILDENGNITCHRCGVILTPFNDNNDSSIYGGLCRECAENLNREMGLKVLQNEN